MSVICPIFLLKSNSIDWLPRKNLHIRLVLLPYKSANIEVMVRDKKTAKKHLLLNYPSRLVACLRAGISAQRFHTEILCKRMSWIVAQTMVRQLVSVVNTSI